MFKLSQVMSLLFDSKALTVDREKPKINNCIANRKVIYYLEIDNKDEYERQRKKFSY